MSSAPLVDALFGVRKLRWSGTGVAAAIWMLFALNFEVFTIATDGDARVQYTLVRRIFGSHDHAVGYQFGLAIIEIPFYGIGRLVATLGIAKIGHAPVEQATIAFAVMLATLATLLLTARLIRSLGLPFSNFAALAATFGMPLFYYGTWEPGKDHVWDTLLFVGALLVLLAYERSGFTDTTLLVVLGVLFGFAATVRYFSAPAAGVLLISLLVLRRFRHAMTFALVAAATWGLLLLVPLMVGASLTGDGYDSRVLAFDPLAPVKMLVTDHRGLFVWSPIALVGLAGYLRLLRRGQQDRTFFVIAGTMAIAILLSYSAVSYWDGTWSFSQRFLTPLTPLVAVGIAALSQLSRRWTLALSTIAVAWTVFLALNLELIGPPANDYSTIRGGASDMALQVTRDHVTLGEYIWALRHRARLIP
jgi:hypothetical protein